MSAITFLNVTRTAPLVTAPPSWYRLVFARSRLATDGAWLAEMQRIYNEFEGRVRIAYTVSPLAATRTDTAAVIDVKPSSGIGGKTVADLADAVSALCDRFGVDTVGLQSIARVPAVNASGDQFAKSRDAALAAGEKKVDDARADDLLGGLFARFRSLGSVAYWLIVALAVCLAALVLWKAYSVAERVAK